MSVYNAPMVLDRAEFCIRRFVEIWITGGGGIYVAHAKVDDLEATYEIEEGCIGPAVDKCVAELYTMAQRKGAA